MTDAEYIEWACSISIDDVVHFASEIKAKCPKAVSILKDLNADRKEHTTPLFFWRGSKNNNVCDFEHKHRSFNDRSPTDMPYDYHSVVNNFTMQQLNKPVRDGLFTVLNVDTANAYGVANAIFPIGEFEYYWIPNVSDLYVELVSSISSKNSEKDIIKYLTKHPYVNSGLNRNTLTNTKSEIIIFANEYYSVGRAIAGLDTFIDGILS